MLNYHPHPAFSLPRLKGGGIFDKGEGLARLPLRGTSGQGGGVKHGRPELNKRTLPRVRQQLLPADNHIIIYCQNYYALLKPIELVEFLVTLDEETRNKIAKKCRRLRLELNGVMRNPRPP